MGSSRFARLFSLSVLLYHSVIPAKGTFQKLSSGGFFLYEVL